MIRMIQACAKFPPPILREAGIGGVVYLHFNVNEYGNIQDETILKSAHPKLDKAALEAL
jgi:TonB family protein